MSNLPKIKAFCGAGCAWETVHRSEFEKSASMIAIQPNSDNYYILEIGKRYKIESTFGGGYAYSIIPYITMTDSNGTAYAEKTGTAVDFSLVTHDIYTEQTYKFCGVEVRASGTVLESGQNEYIVKAIYELFGERAEQDIYSFGSYYTSLPTAAVYWKLIATNINNVYLYNKNAEILAKDGADGVPLKPCFISTTDTFPTEFPSEYSGVVVSGDAVIGNLAIVNYTSEGKGAYGYITAISNVIATINLVGVFCRNGELYEYTLTVDDVTDSSTVTRLYNIATKAKGAVYVKDNSGYSYQITRSDYVRGATVRRLVTFTREYSISPNFNKVEYTATVVNNSLGTTKSEIVFSSTGTTITETAGGWTSLTITYYNDTEITE